jgi:acyl carrier protein
MKSEPSIGATLTEPTDPLLPELARKLVETLGLDMAPESVDPAAPLIGAGLGIDSIDTLELVVMIDKDYGVKIDNRAAGVKAFASLDALAAFIRTHRPTLPA